MPAAERGDTRRDPNVLLIVAGLLLLARVGFGVYEERRPAERIERVTWQPIAAAESLSKATGKPILYDFSADWCGPCQTMKREVFADRAAAETLDRSFVPVRVLDRQREEGRNPPEVDTLQARFKVNAFPTLVVTAPGYAEPVVFEGYEGRDRTLEHLARAGASVRTASGGRPRRGTFVLPLRRPGARADSAAEADRQ